MEHHEPEPGFHEWTQNGVRLTAQPRSGRVVLKLRDPSMPEETALFLFDDFLFKLAEAIQAARKLTLT